MRGDLRTRKTVKRCSHVFARLSNHGESLTVEFVLPPSLAAGLAVRYQHRAVRRPAAHAPGVRSGRSCHTQPTRPWGSPVRPAVGSGVVSVRHARPAAHTLRAVVRSAAVTCSSAPVQSISQRGRQRLAAAVAQQPPHATGNRLPAAPAASEAQQSPSEAAPGPRSPSRNPNRSLHQ